MNLPDCPVCESGDTGLFFHDAKGRDYFRCQTCRATFLDSDQFLSRQAEYAHYCTHENRVDDPRYRKFLSRLAEPLLEQLTPPACGLDYGCGPGPALAAMLKEKGHNVSVYDPFFAADEAVLSETYNFVTCTEVVEHFHKPQEEFSRLASLLKPEGILAVMTALQIEDDSFKDWHYRADPTHVVFYHSATFEVVAARLGLAISSPATNVVFLHAK